MTGVTIGNNVIIGANAIVTKDLESNGVYAGVPARKIRNLEEYYEKIKNEVILTKLLPPKEKKKYLLKIFESIND